jgi:hypothetical protein
MERIPQVREKRRVVTQPAGPETPLRREAGEAALGLRSHVDLAAAGDVSRDGERLSSKGCRHQRQWVVLAGARI